MLFSGWLSSQAHSWPQPTPTAQACSTSPDDQASPTPDNGDVATPATPVEGNVYTNNQFWNFVDDQLLELYTSVEEDCDTEEEKEFVNK